MPKVARIVPNIARQDRRPLAKRSATRDVRSGDCRSSRIHLGARSGDTQVNRGVVLLLFLILHRAQAQESHWHVDTQGCPGCSDAWDVMTPSGSAGPIGTGARAAFLDGSNPTCWRPVVSEQPTSSKSAIPTVYQPIAVLATDDGGKISGEWPITRALLTDKRPRQRPMYAASKTNTRRDALPACEDNRPLPGFYLARPRSHTTDGYP